MIIVSAIGLHQAMDATMYVEKCLRQFLQVAVDNRCR